MRLNRPSYAATNDARTAQIASPRCHRARAALVRLGSVTAVATATCALWALPASAATAAPHAKHPSTTSVSASPSSAFVGAGVRLSATVHSSGRTPTGTVAFRASGRALCSAHLSHGSASCVTSFGAPGTFTVRGFYSGDRTHAGSVGATRESVRRSGTTTNITNPSPGIIKVGDSYIFNVTVTSPAGTPAATGTVRLAPVVPTTLPGYTCTATVIAGQGSCKVTPSEFGIDKYKATYTGNAAHFGSVSDGKFDLAVQNVTTTTVTAPSTTHGSVTLNAAVHAMGANITFAAGGRGSVAFYLSATPTGTQTVVTGCAAVSLTTFDAGTGNNNAICTSNAALNALPAGTYYITAVFSGDDVNVKSTSAQFKLVLT
jgi:hypothetical protein